VEAGSPDAEPRGTPVKSRSSFDQAPTTFFDARSTLSGVMRLIETEEGWFLFGDLVIS
jgi:hypothetical protein